jgi:3-hydroxybutyrate dehydrogenase
VTAGDVGLTGRAAVVTGSTSGIGFGVADALATQRAAVLLNGFGPVTVIDAAIAHVSACGTPVAYSAADVSKPDEIRAMVAQESAAGIST